MIRSMIAATAIALSLTTCGLAQVELRWKIADNEKITTTARTNVHQVLSLAGQEIETKTEQTVVAAGVTGARAADGTIRQATKIESMQANLSLPGGVEIEFDSAKPVEPQGTQYDILLDLLQAVSQTSSTTVFGEDNRVQSIEVDRSQHEKLDDQVKEMIKARLDADYLKEVSNKGLDQIPSAPVKVGDTWTVTKTLRLEAGQSLTFTTGYQYAGTADKDGQKLDKITFATSEVDYEQEASDSPARVTDSDLKIESSTGTLYFDRAHGRIVEQEETVHIKGDLTIEASGQEIPAKLDLKFDSKTTVASGAKAAK